MQVSFFYRFIKTIMIRATILSAYIDMMHLQICQCKSVPKTIIEKKSDRLIELNGLALVPSEWSSNFSVGWLVGRSIF